jgi:hypothetical protein
MQHLLLEILWYRIRQQKRYVLQLSGLSREEGSQRTHVPRGLGWVLLGTAMIEQRLFWRRASNIIMAMVESLVCFLFPDGA